jgi:hypothetical protein
MRPFRLSIFIFAVIMTWACLGCDRTFDTSKGLDIHRHSCKRFASTTRLLLKRTQQQERPDPAKIARRLGEPTLAVGSNNISSEGTSNAATVSLVKRSLQDSLNILSCPRTRQVSSSPSQILGSETLLYRPISQSLLGLCFRLARGARYVVQKPTKTSYHPRPLLLLKSQEWCNPCPHV